MRIEYAAPFVTFFQELTDSEEILLYGVIVNYCVVHTLLIITELTNDLVHALGVAIARAEETLGASLVPKSAPLGDESGEMSVSRVDGDTVVSMEAVNHTLDLPCWYR